MTTAPSSARVRAIVIVATHPIQYQVPWFQALTRAGAIRPTVLYALIPDDSQQGVGFNRRFQWEIPMFAGYECKALPNARKEPLLCGFFTNSTPSIQKVLAQNRPEAVVITGWNSWPLVQALWGCISLGIPAIIRGESNSVRHRPWWVRLGHRDTPALAACLRKMAGDPAAAGAMGERARARIAAYSVENAAAATLKAIEFMTIRKTSP